MPIIPMNSQLYGQLESLAKEKRMIMLAGLIGTGKSLLIQQLALIANQLGRKVHLIQYDVARKAFETEDILAKYPEQDGFTDPAIRKALGLWSRDAVLAWHKQYPEKEHLLIGELPLIGNRLIELIDSYDDQLEAELSKESTTFIIPVPSWEVREVIAENRAASLQKPKHELEKRDAPPNVIEALWHEVNALARDIGLTKTRPDTPYNPYIYGGVYEALLQNRYSQALLLTEILKPSTSVYDLYESDVIVSDLAANTEQIDHFITQVETIERDVLVKQVENWHKKIEETKLPDCGVALSLPLPESLVKPDLVFELNTQQRSCIDGILSAPLDAESEEIIPLLDKAIENFDNVGNAVIADVHKFDVFDSYFNVKRKDNIIAYIKGLLESYRNILENLDSTKHELTVVELPLLRIGLETSLRQVYQNTKAEGAV